MTATKPASNVRPVVSDAHTAAKALPAHEAAAIIFREGYEDHGTRDGFRGQGLMRAAFAHRAVMGDYCTTYDTLDFPGVVRPGEKIRFHYDQRWTTTLIHADWFVIAAYRHKGQRYQVGPLLVSGFRWKEDTKTYEAADAIYEFEDAQGRKVHEARVLAVAYDITISVFYRARKIGGGFHPLEFERRHLPAKTQRRETDAYYASYKRFRA